MKLTSRYIILEKLNNGLYTALNAHQNYAYAKAEACKHAMKYENSRKFVVAKVLGVAVNPTKQVYTELEDDNETSN